MAIDTDTVRLLIGDTDASDQILTDDQIDAISALYGDTYQAAAGAADAIAARYARRISMSVDGASVNYSDLSRQYRDLATRLRVQGTAQGVTPFVAGISISEMDSVDTDPDRNPSRFKVGMSDFPGSIQGASNDTDVDEQ